MNHRWGWCGEGCPLGNDTTRGTDETLTVTTHTVLQVDKDLYVIIVLLILIAFCLFSFTRTLQLHGTHVTFILLKIKPECEIKGFLCFYVLESEIDNFFKDVFYHLTCKNEFLKGSPNPTKSKISLIISYCNLLIHI